MGTTARMPSDGVLYANEQQNKNDRLHGLLGILFEDYSLSSYSRLKRAASKEVTTFGNSTVSQ